METAVKKFTEDEVNIAFELAKKTQQPLLIDFWHTNCKGCQRMDAVTYEDTAVQEYLEQQYILVKYNTGNITKDFSHTFLTSALLWTPAFYIYSPDGAIVRNVSGYLSPNQFITELSIGKAMLLMRRGKATAALELLESLPNPGGYPSLEQERLYWAGAAAFYANHKNFAAVEPYWRKLTEDHPGSSWAEKADFFPPLS